MTSLDLPGVLDVLAGQELLLGVFLAGTGLVFMIFGYRLYRPLVAISFGVVGFVLCSLLPGPMELRLGLGFLGAVALGAISTFFIKASLATLAGTWMAYVAILLSGLFEVPLEAKLTVAALAFGGAVSLSLIMYHEVTAFVLSMEGSLLLIGGMVIFMNQSPIFWSHMRDLLVSNPIFAPFVLVTGTVTGFYWQMSEQRQREAGTSG